MIKVFDNEKSTSWQNKIEVSVIIPVYNEEKYIEKCIASVLNQDFDKTKIEVLFIDGNSEDKTKEIIASYSKKYPFIRLLNNPKRKIPNALNIGIKASEGEYILRMDAHAQYANDFISKNMEYSKKTGAENVGGPAVARGENPIQKAIAAAYHSKFAMGGGKYHDENYEGYADTVFLGMFKKETLLKINLYDENLPFAEDDDLNYRIIENGGKIFITPKIKSVYYPRSSYKALFKQYFNFGMCKVSVIKKHKKPARLSHLVPISFVLFLIIGAILSFFSKTFSTFYAAILALYLALNVYFSVSNKHAKTVPSKLRLILIHFILHISYGIGFLTGMFKVLKHR